MRMFRQQGGLKAATFFVSANISATWPCVWKQDPTFYAWIRDSKNSTTTATATLNMFMRLFMGENNSCIMPYKGLMPYSDSKEDAQFFFGREQKQEIITANLMASRLTLLYGPSGVGKSSVLRAGVAYHLQQQAEQFLNEGRVPEFAVVVFDSWRDDPVAALTQQIEEVVMPLLKGRTFETSASSDIVKRLADLTTPKLRAEPPNEDEQPTIDLLVILDQFEEYFLYHAKDEGEGTFDYEFPRVVNNPELGVNFLISIRDDSLAKLDHFKGRIHNLFTNRLSIEHLDIKAAREAIVKPLEQFNRLQLSNGEKVINPEKVKDVLAQDGRQVGIEPQLVETVLKQVKTGQVVLGQTGRGTIKDDAGVAADIQIETPFLQLVLTRLWAAEREADSRVLRLETLKQLGGAEKIVQTHLDKVMSELPSEEQDIAARIFYYLVTPSLTKIAHSASALAFYCKLPQSQIENVLTKLAYTVGGGRILRSVAAAGGDEEPDETRYEIFHDVLASAILDWRTRHEQKLEQERAKAEAEKRLGRERAEAERLAAEKQLELDRANALAKAESKRAEAEEERAKVELQRSLEHAKAARRFRWATIGLAVLLLLALATSIYAIKVRNDALNAKKDADQARAEAEKAKGEAEKAKGEAIIAQQEEKKKADEAESLRQSESVAKQKAESEQQRAEEQAALAAQRAAQAKRAENSAIIAQKKEAKKADEAETAHRTDNLYREAFRLSRRSDKRMEAIDKFNQALKDYRRTGDHLAEIDTLLNIGAVYTEDNDTSKALDSFKNALNSSKEGKEKAFTFTSIGDIYKDSYLWNTAQNKPKAIEYYEHAAELYESLGEKEKGNQAGVLLKMGQVYTRLVETRRSANQEQDINQAIGYFEKARTLYHDLSDHRGEASALLNSAKALQNLNTDEATQKVMDYLNRALALCDKVKNSQPEDRRIEIDVLKYLASINFQLGESQKAIEALMEAAGIYHSLNDRAGEVETNVRIAYYYYDQKEKLAQNASKITFPLDQARKLYKEEDNREKLAEVLQYLGAVYKELKDYEKAIEVYEELLDYYRKQVKSKPSEFYLLSMLTDLAVASGNNERARAYLDQSLQGLQQLTEPKDKLSALIYIGSDYLSFKDLDAAAGSFNQALEISKQLSDKSPQDLLSYFYSEAQTLSSIGAKYASHGFADKALDYFNKAIELWQQKKDRDGETSTLRQVAEVYFGQKDYKRAIVYYEQAEKGYQDIHYSRGEADAVEHIGLSYRALGDNKKADEYEQRARTIMKSNRLGRLSYSLGP